MAYKDPIVGRQRRREQSARRRVEYPELIRKQRRDATRRCRALNPLAHRGYNGNVELLREASRMYAAARRARKRSAFIEHVRPQTVYEMHGGRCGICGEYIEGTFHVDHVVPLARGGKHGYINVQPAHPFCNWSKGARLV